MRHLERKIYSNVWGHSAQASKAVSSILISLSPPIDADIMKIT